MKTLLLLLVSVFVFPVRSEETAPSAAPTPVPTVESKAPEKPAPSHKKKAETAWTGEAAVLRKELGTLFEESKHVNDADAAAKARARGTIDSTFDWAQIAKECLGEKEWDKRSVAERDSFVRLLKDVIQRTAYGRLEIFWKGADYRFEKIDITGEQAGVAVQFLKDGDDGLMEYKLRKKGGKWTLYDLAYEGNYYGSNINQQIKAFLKENNFSKFLEKLKKRRDELAAQ